MSLRGAATLPERRGKLVGPAAEETINLFALAIRHDLTASDLKAAVFSYPTAASDIAYML